MKAAELAELLLEHPRANVVIAETPESSEYDPVVVTYNAHTNNIIIEQ